jgi:hypothetical protein
MFKDISRNVYLFDNPVNKMFIIKKLFNKIRAIYKFTV